MTTGSRILCARQDNTWVLKFCGEVRLSMAPSLGAFVSSIGQSGEMERIVIDLCDVECIDSTILGLLAKISLRAQEALNALPTIISSRDDVTRILFSMGFDSIFVIVGAAEDEAVEAGELPTHLIEEDELRQQVIDAHRTLMSLNEANEEAFRDLVDSLEGEHLLAQSRVRVAR